MLTRRRFCRSATARLREDSPEETAVFNNPNLFVVSGGPGSGKTTVLQELTKLGFPHAPEVARQIIREQIAIGGAALPWQDRQRYTSLMLERSIESYAATLPSIDFSATSRDIAPGAPQWVIPTPQANLVIDGLTAIATPATGTILKRYVDNDFDVKGDLYGFIAHLSTADVGRMAALKDGLSANAVHE